MTPRRPGSSVIEFPNELDILLTREFEAPLELVFDVLTKEEHVRKTIAPYGEEVKLCSVDLRVGGDYHYIFVSDDGTDMSFHGTSWRSSRRPAPPRRGSTTGGRASRRSSRSIFARGMASRR